MDATALAELAARACYNYVLTKLVAKASAGFSGASVAWEDENAFNLARPRFEKHGYSVSYDKEKRVVEANWYPKSSHVPSEKVVPTPSEKKNITIDDLFRIAQSDLENMWKELAKAEYIIAIRDNEGRNILAIDLRKHILSFGFYCSPRNDATTFRTILANAFEETIDDRYGYFIRYPYPTNLRPVTEWITYGNIADLMHPVWVVVRIEK